MKPSPIHRFDSNVVVRRAVHFAVSIAANASTNIAVNIGVRSAASLGLFLVLSAVVLALSSCATNNAARQYFGYRNSYPPPQSRPDDVQSKNRTSFSPYDRRKEKLSSAEDTRSELSAAETNHSLLFDGLGLDDMFGEFTGNGGLNAFDDEEDTKDFYNGYAGQSFSLGSSQASLFWEQPVFSAAGYAPLWHQAGWGRWSRWNAWNYWNRWNWWHKPWRPHFWNHWRAWQRPRFWYYRFPVHFPAHFPSRLPARLFSVQASYWDTPPAVIPATMPATMPTWQYGGRTAQYRQPAQGRPVQGQIPLISASRHTSEVAVQPSQQPVGQGVLERQSRDFGVQRPHSLGGVQQTLPAAQQNTPVFSRRGIVDNQSGSSSGSSASSPSGSQILPQSSQTQPSPTVQVWQQPDVRSEVRPESRAAQRVFVVPAEEPIKRGSVVEGSTTGQRVEAVPDYRRSSNDDAQPRFMPQPPSREQRDQPRHEVYRNEPYDRQPQGRTQEAWREKSYEKSHEKSYEKVETSMPAAGASSAEPVKGGRIR